MSFSLASAVLGLWVKEVRDGEREGEEGGREGGREGREGPGEDLSYLK